MSTLTEIEAALPKLSAEELAHVEVTLRRLRNQVGSLPSGAEIAELERRNGFDVFLERDGKQVTVDAVRQLCAEEGI